MDDFDQCGKCGNSHDGACSTEPVHFYWYPPANQQVEQVSVVGDWTKWQRKEPMTIGLLDSGEPYFYTLLALSEGFHEYKYLVDGRWAVDPKAPTVPNPMGSLNNRVEVHRFPPRFSPRSPTWRSTRGQGSGFHLTSACRDSRSLAHGMDGQRKE